MGFAQQLLLVPMWLGTPVRHFLFALMGAPIVVFADTPFVLFLGPLTYQPSPVEVATWLPLSSRIWVKGACVTPGKQFAVCHGSDTLCCSCHILGAI